MPLFLTLDKMAKKKAAPKKETAKKETPKATAPKAVKVDLKEKNTLEAVKDSKHMKKGQIYKGIGRETTQSLIDRGLCKLA